MPRSVFLGRPMPGPGEPLWTADDRAWALALIQVESEKCPDCGHPWSEATDIGHEFSYQAELLRCHACTAGAKAVSAYQDGRGDSRGLHVQIMKRG